MNEEIEEMMLTVPQKIVAYDGNHAVQHLYREQRQEIAEALYNAGYRKIENANGHNLPHEIDYLLTEFDEMGFVPTSLCDNPEGKAKLWKSALVYEIGLLLDEYAAIKEKAVKEFSEKLIKLVFDYLDVENAEQAEKLSIIDSTLTYNVILGAIDKLIEEEN